MNIFKIRKIKRLIEENNFGKLTLRLNKLNDKEVEEIFRELDRVKATNYLDYIIRKGNLRLFLLLSINSSFIKAQMIINYIPLKGFTNMYYDNLINRLFFEKIDDFVNIVKKGDVNKDIVAYIISFCMTRGLNGRLEDIKAYLLEQELDERLLHFWASPTFNSKEFRDKLRDSGSDKIIKYLYLSDNTEVFVREYVKSYPKINDLKVIALEFFRAVRINKKNVYYTLLNEVRNLDNSNKDLKGEYLYTLLEIDGNNIDKDNIVLEIIALKNLEVIQKLVGMLNQEEQQKLVEKYANSDDLEAITMLAITIKSKVLIDKVIASENDDYITFMVGNLENEALDYALGEILKFKKASYFTDLINRLYLEGYSNILIVISFVFKYNLEYLFTEKVVNNWKKFREELINNLTLTKK